MAHRLLLRAGAASPVEVVVVSPQPLRNKKSATGTLLANKEVELRPEISGLVTGVFFKEGQSVSKSELMLKINDRELQAQLKRKSLEEKLASDEESRKRRLFEIKGISQEEYDKSLNLNGKQYQVIAQANRANRDEPVDLGSVYVRNTRNELIQLDNVVSMSYRSSPPQLYRYNRYVAATISASAAKGYTLGRAIDEMDKIAKSVLDESFSTALAGTSKEYTESSNTLLFAFLLALTLVYLILSAQFESFRDPLTIMFTVPLALAGAIISLWMFGQTFNIFSQIGIIALVGIVTKNGILIVEFANQRREQGLAIKDAVIDAALQRFRPILMTSLATVFGALPIAMALGASAKSRMPMGIVIIGGLIFSLGLTLYVIPALYTYLSSKKARQQHDLVPDAQTLETPVPEKEQPRV